MRLRSLISALALCVISLTGMTARSDIGLQIAGEPVSVIGNLTPEGKAVIRNTSQGIILSFKNSDGGKLWTKEEYKTPLVITAQVSTSDTNIRLYYGDHGIVILDWEMNQHELRHHDPKTGSQSGIANEGYVSRRTRSPPCAGQSATGNRASTWTAKNAPISLATTRECPPESASAPATDRRSTSSRLP
jgi:hypothetical protein